MKVTDGFNQTGKYKAEGKNERDAIVSSAKPHQRIGGIAETQQRTAYLKIQISLIAAGNVRTAQVHHSGQKGRAQRQKCQGPSSRRPAAEKLGDCGPKSQENPQIPDKNQQSPKDAR